MTIYNAGKISGLAATAGFAPGETEIATAIALAESGGNTTAHNTTPPDDSYGLWQINMYGDLGPARRKQFGISKNSQLFDPNTNANAAHMVYKQSGWKAWTTYTNGAYKKHMDYVTNGGIPGAVQDTKDATATALSGITKGLDTFGKNFFTAASNFTAIIVAVVILIAGIILLGRNSLPISRIRKTVTK